MASFFVSPKIILCCPKMPAKRKASELTGGTGDVNPQTYVLQSPVINLNQGPTAPTPGAIGFPLPVPRYSASNGRSIVFEILEVEWFLPNFNAPAANGTNITLVGALTTNPLTPAADNSTDPLYSQFIGDPKNISLMGVGKTTFLVTNGAFYDDTFIHKVDDLTDAAGHGLLVATDTIYLAWLGLVQGGPGALTTQFTARVSYRLKEVSLAEYIGIVQSQQ